MGVGRRLVVDWLVGWLVVDHLLLIGGLSKANGHDIQYPQTQHDLMCRSCVCCLVFGCWLVGWCLVAGWLFVVCCWLSLLCPFLGV